MADVFFRIKVGDDVYELDKLTLGDAAYLRREHGLTSFSDLSSKDPDQLVGLLFLAMKRKHPNLTDAALKAEVDGIDFLSLAQAAEEPVDVPLPDAPAPADDVPLSGSLGTTPEQPGDQS